MANSTHANSSLRNLTDIERERGYKTVEVIVIVTVALSLSLVTIIGNILVMLSIKVNRQLQTINNYFIFSLACADLIVGVFSMNLYTSYIVIGYWPMGPVLCDLWLALDYVVSYASVMNILIISFDQYFCVTRPLSYPVQMQRTTKMALMMIVAAWVLSFTLWAPAILFWQFIVGGRTVKEGECYVQFLSNPTVTFGTGIAAFYLPVITMTILYVHISRASKSRIKKDTNESESKKGTISPSLVRGKIMKPNNNNISSAPDGLLNVKVQNGKATGEVMTDHCGQREENRVSDPSTSLSAVPSILKEEGKIDESTKVSTAQRRFNNSISKLSCIKVGTNSQKSDNCATTVEMMSDNSTKTSKDRELTAAHKTPAEKKKGAATRENKVTRTILAILLALIITWTPYSVMVLINTSCSICVPNILWTIGYWLCYVNSTINPACYALCNATFKKSFKHLLFCQYKNIGATR